MLARTLFPFAALLLAAGSIPAVEPAVLRVKSTARDAISLFVYCEACKSFVPFGGRPGTEAIPVAAGQSEKRALPHPGKYYCVFRSASGEEHVYGTVEVRPGTMVTVGLDWRSVPSVTTERVKDPSTGEVKETHRTAYKTVYSYFREVADLDGRPLPPPRPADAP